MKYLKNLLSLILMGIMLIPNVAFAAPQIVTGTQRLLQDAFGWLLILIPLGAALGIGWQAFLKTMADGDPNVIASRNKTMKTIGIAAIIGMTASGTIYAILAYYQ